MVSKFIRNIHNKLQVIDGHTVEVIKKSVSSTIVKVAGMLVGLGVSIFLGRRIGAEGLGVLNLVDRVINLLIIVSLFGMRQVIIKEIAIAHNRNDKIHVGNVIFTSSIINGLLSVGLSIVIVLLSPFLIENVFHEPRLKWPLIIALVAMTPQVFSRIFSSALVGYRKIWQSNLVEQTLSSVIVALILTGFWLSDKPITILNSALAYGIARFAVMFSVGTYWKKISGINTKKQKLISAQLLKTAKPLFLVSVTFVVASNADVIMLGWLGNSEMVGLYSIAARVALLTSFFLQVTNAAISPKIAALYEEGKKYEMEKMVQSVTLGLVGIASFAVLIIVLFGKTILSIWGIEFQAAYPLLIILSIGQFFNIGTGASGLILMLCGLEKTQAWISSVFVVLNLILNYFLIKKYGALGAAIATSLTVSLDNLSRVIFAKIKLNIWSIPIILKK